MIRSVFNLYPGVNLPLDIIYRFSIFDTLRVREIQPAEQRIYRAARKNVNLHQSEDSRPCPDNSDKTQSQIGLIAKFLPVPFFFFSIGSNSWQPNLLSTILNWKFGRSTDTVYHVRFVEESTIKNNCSHISITCVSNFNFLREGA